MERVKRKREKGKQVQWTWGSINECAIGLPLDTKGWREERGERKEERDCTLETRHWKVPTVQCSLGSLDSLGSLCHMEKNRWVDISFDDSTWRCVQLHTEKWPDAIKMITDRSVGPSDCNKCPSVWWSGHFRSCVNGLDLWWRVR